MGLDISALLVAGIIVKEAKIVQEVQKYNEDTGLPYKKEADRFKYEFSDRVLEFDKAGDFITAISAQGLEVWKNGPESYLIYARIEETESHRFGNFFKEIQIDNLCLSFERARHKFSGLNIAESAVRLYLVNDIC